MSYLLKIVAGREVGREFPLEAGENLVGRSRSARIRVFHEDVSGKHFIIEVLEDQVRLRNLSSYGTRLDGILVRDAVEIHSGQTIEAGKSLKLILEQAAEQESPETSEVSDETSVTRFLSDLPEHPLPEPDPVESEDLTGITRFSTDLSAFSAEEDNSDSEEDRTSVTKFATEISGTDAEQISSDRKAHSPQETVADEPLPVPNPLPPAAEQSPNPSQEEKTGSLFETCPPEQAEETGTFPDRVFPSLDDNAGSVTESDATVLKENFLSGPSEETCSSPELKQETSPLLEEQGVFFEEELDDSEKTNPNETQILQTRMASMDEINFIKSQIRKQQQSRLFFKFLIFVLFVVLLGIIWMLKSPMQEKTLSWPRETSNGQSVYRIGYARGFEKGFQNGGFDVYYPKWENVRLDSEKKDRLVIHSFLGKKGEVPLTIILQREESNDFLYENRATAMRNMLRRLSEHKEELFNFDQTPNVGYLVPAVGSPDNGILCNVTAYQRDSGSSWFGILRFFRNEKYNYILRAEVPAEEKLRALPVLSRETFLYISPAFVKAHWEGSDEYTRGDLDRLLLGVRNELLNHNSPMQYPRLELAIKSILAQAYSSRQSKQYSEAMELLLNLRDKQKQWYNGQKIRWFSAHREKNKAEQTKIRNESEAVFSIPGDKRRYDILRDYWE